MDISLRTRAYLFDLATCGTEHLAQHNHKPRVKVQIPYSDWGGCHDPNVETARLSKFLGSPRLLGELVPVLRLARLPVAHSEPSEDLWNRPVLYRFSSGGAEGAVLHAESKRGLPDRLERELRSCVAKDRVSAKLARFIFAVPKVERELSLCQAILRKYYGWLDN